jgi:hypothetical protein
VVSRVRWLLERRRGVERQGPQRTIVVHDD